MQSICDLRVKSIPINSEAWEGLYRTHRAFCGGSIQRAEQTEGKIENKPGKRRKTPSTWVVVGWSRRRCWGVT